MHPEHEDSIGRDARPVVLLVEDEVSIRAVVADDLRERGVVVLEATDALEALAILAMPVRVDVVFSDVQMPGEIDGFGLVGRIRLTRPDCKVMLTSARPWAVDGMEEITFLMKPYSVDAVMQAIGSLLESGK